MRKEDFVYLSKLYTLYKECTFNKEDSQGDLYPFCFSGKLNSDKNDSETSFCIYSIYEKQKLLGQISVNQITLNADRTSTNLPIVYLAVNNDDKLMRTDLIKKLIARIKRDFKHVRYFYCFDQKTTKQHKEWSFNPVKKYQNSKVNLLTNNL